MMTNKEYREEKAIQYWRSWMEIGEKTGCHQRPDRSFYFRGYQMPVCARCSGVIIGYLMAIPSFLLFGFTALLSVGGSIALLTDWLLQASGVRTSTNNRRLITGILGGFGIMSIQLFAIKKAILALARYSVRK